METPERGALMLVRFTAVALIGWTLVELALYVAISQHNSIPITFLPCLNSLPPIIGRRCHAGESPGHCPMGRR
jgi:hypothetical protein